MRLTSALVMGVTLHGLNTAYTTRHTDASLLPTVKAPAEELKGTEIGKDGKTYRVWWVLNPRPGVQAGKYLVDESLQAREFVDPGIGGRMTTDENGAKIQKFNPAQPQLFATLIQGIMSRDLPWGLVIIGAVLAIVMQLCGVSALAYAVGVYSAAVDHAADLRRRAGAQGGRQIPRVQRRRGGYEPRHADVDRPDRRRIARRHHRRVPGLLSRVESTTRLRCASRAAARSFKISSLARILRDGRGPLGGGLDRQAADLGRGRSGDKPCSARSANSRPATSFQPALYDSQSPVPESLTK